MSNLHPRTCRQCEAIFDGGPRAWYCPICREDRRRKASRDGKRRERARETRPLGSKDSCAVCGKEYVVNSGKQKYCPTCAPEAVAEIDREQGIAYYHDNAATINPARNARRRQTRRDKKMESPQQTTKPKRGGAGRGQGRKPLFEGPVMRKSVDLPASAKDAIEAAALAQGLTVHQWMVTTILAAAETTQCAKE